MLNSSSTEGEAKALDGLLHRVYRRKSQHSTTYQHALEDGTMTISRPGQRCRQADYE